MSSITKRIIHLLLLFAQIAMPPTISIMKPSAIR